MPCYTSQDGKVTICYTKGRTERAKQTKVAFCFGFGCRKKRVFHRMIFFPERGSYYDPHDWWQCEKQPERNWANHSDEFPR